MFSLCERGELLYVRTPWRVYRLLIIFSASGFPVIIKFQHATCTLHSAKYTCRLFEPGKHQRSKQRFQDLWWKVHDHAQSFVLRSYTMHDYVTKTFLLVISSVWSKQLLCFVHSQDQKKRTKAYNKELCWVS